MSGLREGNRWEMSERQGEGNEREMDEPERQTVGWGGGGEDSEKDRKV